MYRDIAGAILAGGGNSRMGSPKAFLSVKGRRIIDTILEIHKTFFDEILIVTDDESCFAGFEDVRIVEDIMKGYGPLGGIYTGLKFCSKERVFFVACDMPFLHNGLIKRLLESAEDKGLDSVIPYTEEGIEPLHGVYSKGMLTEIEASLMKKELSVAGVLNRFNCKYIKAEKDELSSFFNINRPKDLKETESYGGKI